MSGEPEPAVEMVAPSTEMLPPPRSVAKPAQWSPCVVTSMSPPTIVPPYVASRPRELPAVVSIVTLWA